LGVFDPRGKGVMAERLPRDVVRALSQVSAWRGLAHVAGEWLAIAGAVALCERCFHPLLYVVTVMWIGARQHALLILMHEAAHGRLLPWRRANDGVGAAALAWPVFLCLATYRRTHLAHHRHLRTDADPDFVYQRQKWFFMFPRTRGELARRLLATVSGLATLETLRVMRGLNQRGATTTVPWPRVAFYAATAVLLTALGGWRLLAIYWLVPIVTWLRTITYVRAVAEHHGLDDAHPSRTTLPTRLEALFVAPKHVGYHLDHHLYPSVPFYRLPALHRALLGQPDYARRAHITRGYLGVLRECTGARR
jgi:fatty acid desaturase